MNHAAIVEMHRRLRASDPRRLTDEWFPEQAAFYNSKARLIAALCGRRAGKTRGLAAHFVRQAVGIPGSRQLYINTTRDEARKLFWIGANRDGVWSLVEQLKIAVKPDQTRLELHFTDTDSWIFLKGAKDEVELSKALGDNYDEIAWDEAQKIRPSMAPTIREVTMPTLLDRGARLRFTGSANRQQSGIFWDITKPGAESKWEVHRWNLLANPHFGRAVTRDGKHYVHALGNRQVLGPFPQSTIQAEVAAARMRFGIAQLAEDLEVPIDSPIIQREGFGLWTPEDSAFVYHIRKCANPYYAPVRVRGDGFPDIAACLADLPGDWTDYMFSLGGDLGFRDAFALHCWAWRPHDRNLYEVFSWKKTELDSDQQFNAVKEVRAVLPLGQVVVDASGAGLATSTAWSKVFVERYNLPIVPAEKHQKDSFQAVYNTDISNGRCRFREGGETAEEMLQLQFTKLVTGTGKQIEDPTQDNHCCDASLYSHRASYQYRAVPKEDEPPPGSAARYAREAAAIEEDLDEEFDQPWRRRGVA